MIALACRRLPERQRRLGIIWGVAGAIGLRVILIFFALQLLAIPFLKVAGAAFLIWIGGVAGLVFLKAKKFLYSPQRLTGKQIFGEVEQMYLREGETPGWDGVNKRTKLGDARWNALVQRTKEKLRAMGVNFDIEDRLSLNNEETNKNDYAPEPFTVDVKKGSSFDVKFTLATLFKAKAMDQSNSLSLEMPEAQIDSEVLGYKLLNFSTAFATLLERLSNTSGVNNTMDKLIELAANDSDYVRMFTRLGGKKDKSVPYGDFKAEDWRFFISCMQTFTRQRPDAMVQRVAGGQTFDPAQ